MSLGWASCHLPAVGHRGALGTPPGMGRAVGRCCRTMTQCRCLPSQLTNVTISNFLAHIENPPPFNAKATGQVTNVTISKFQHHATGHREDIRVGRGIGDRGGVPGGGGERAKVKVTLVFVCLWQVGLEI